MACAGPETVGVAALPAWKNLDAASFCDGEIFAQLCRGVNIREDQIERSNTSWTTIGVDPTDASLGNLVDDNTINYGYDLLVAIKAAINGALNDNFVDGNCKRWGWKDKASIQMSLNAITVTEVAKDREAWYDIILELRAVLDAMDELYFDGWVAYGISFQLNNLAWQRDIGDFYMNEHHYIEHTFENYPNPGVWSKYGYWVMELGEWNLYPGDAMGTSADCLTALPDYLGYAWSIEAGHTFPYYNGVPVAPWLVGGPTPPELDYEHTIAWGVLLERWGGEVAGPFSMPSFCTADRIWRGWLIRRRVRARYKLVPYNAESAELLGKLDPAVTVEIPWTATVGNAYGFGDHGFTYTLTRSGTQVDVSRGFAEQEIWAELNLTASGIPTNANGLGIDQPNRGKVISGIVMPLPLIKVCLDDCDVARLDEVIWP